MDGEEDGHEGAGPEIVCHPPQHQEQQDRGGGVQQHIREMVAAGVQPVELAVQHVGKPGKRVPVVGVRAGEGPGNAIKAKTVLHVLVFVYVEVVIQVDEVVRNGLTEDHRHHQQEKATNGQRRVRAPERRVPGQRRSWLGVSWGAPHGSAIRASVTSGPATASPSRVFSLGCWLMDILMLLENLLTRGHVCRCQSVARISISLSASGGIMVLFCSPAQAVSALDRGSVRPRAKGDSPRKGLAAHNRCCRGGTRPGAGHWNRNRI